MMNYSNMEVSVTHPRRPTKSDRPEYIYPVPEVNYPPELNVAVELVDKNATERADAPAIYFEDKIISYAELQRRVNRLGNALRDSGIDPGDRVVVRFPNRPEAIVSCLAIQKIGAVALPSMKLLRAKELRYIINDAGASKVIVYDSLVDEINKALPDLETVDEVIVADRNEIAHEYTDYDEFQADADTELDPQTTSRDDLALMLYTSGTTGRPKGAIHTHRHILASADTYARYCLEPTDADVFGGNPPIPFAYGYGDLLTFPFRFGASSSLIEDATPRDLLEGTENHGITILCSVPTAFNQLLSEHPDGPEKYDVSSLRIGMSAGEPLTPTTFDRMKQAYGIELYDGIGTTEMLHIFMSHRISDQIDPSATGYAVPGYEAKVVDPKTGNEVDRGEPGLLAVRGPTGIEYWGRPDKQQESVIDGWSYPGDIFIHRPDGRFEYKSRSDDLIVSSGYNIPGPEVEAVIEEHDAVLESAVIGAPDEQRGEIVKAYVVIEDGATGDEALTKEIQDHVKSTLAPYKYPREIEYTPELPRTETGKIRRTELREQEGS